jgi:ribosomal protein L20A (L18A)
MKMKTFEAKGTYNKNGITTFSKTIKADNEKMAREYIYSLVGGKQRISRRDINIETVVEAK